jgi:hypothetical protein
VWWGGDEALEDASGERGPGREGSHEALDDLRVVPVRGVVQRRPPVGGVAGVHVRGAGPPEQPPHLRHTG